MPRYVGDTYVLLQYAVISCKPWLIQEYVLNGVPVNSQDPYQKYTALHKAAARGWVLLLYNIITLLLWYQGNNFWKRYSLQRIEMEIKKNRISNIFQRRVLFFTGIQLTGAGTLKVKQALWGNQLAMFLLSTPSMVYIIIHSDKKKVEWTKRMPIQRDAK